MSTSTGYEPHTLSPAADVVSKYIETCVGRILRLHISQIIIIITYHIGLLIVDTIQYAVLRKQSHEIHCLLELYVYLQCIRST